MTPTRITPTYIKYYNPIKTYSLDIIKVNLTSEEIDWCKAFKGWSSTDKPDSVYKRGCISTYEPELIGKLGEVAFAKVLNIDTSVDFRYIKYGDNCDFNIRKISLDIKTNSNIRDKGYIQVVSPYGNNITMKSDIYIFNCIKNIDLINNNVQIYIMGYLLKDDIEQLFPIVPSPKKKSKHKNREIHYSKLMPIKKLLKILYDF